MEINESIIYKFIYNRLSTTEEANVFSEEAYQFDVDQEDIMKTMFLKPFLNLATSWQFTHPVDIADNALSNIAKDVFNGEDFITRANAIHKHLKTCMHDPEMGDSDLFIIHYNKLRIDDAVYQGIGVYKVEDKDNYLETQNDGAATFFQIKRGITSKKIDKGVLIINTEDSETIFLIDKGAEGGSYWKDDFVGVNLRRDDINNTTHFMNNAKSFITETFPHEFDVNKVEQADILNRTIDYFKNNEKFVREDYNKLVLQDDNVIEAFKKFDKGNENINEFIVDDEFEIAPQAVKKQARLYKSIIKLDKNFHIYVHGDKENIESGTESNGRKYYKLYYDEES